MIVRHNLFTIFLVLSISGFSYSQTIPQTSEARNEIDVIRIYEQVVADGYGSPSIYKKLATEYYFKSDYEKALLWFQKLSEEEKERDETLMRQYRQTVKAVAVKKSAEGEKTID